MDRRHRSECEITFGALMLIPCMIWITSYYYSQFRLKSSPNKTEDPELLNVTSLSAIIYSSVAVNYFPVVISEQLAFTLIRRWRGFHHAKEKPCIDIRTIANFCSWKSHFAGASFVHLSSFSSNLVQHLTRRVKVIQEKIFTTSSGNAPFERGHLTPSECS